jgi:hypothetical protein
MKTDQLIDMLARNAGAAPRALAARRLWLAAVFGLVVSALAAIGVLGALPAGMFATAVPWTKMAYAGALAIAAGWLTARLSRPAAQTRQPGWATAAVVAVMLAIGGGSLLLQPEGARWDALLGHAWSWSRCLSSVFMLSLPALAAALWAVRGLAPTRPRIAGLAAGLLAGAVGAFGYALSCPEPSPAFVAVWYTLGILLIAALGAALGPRILRW